MIEEIKLLLPLLEQVSDGAFWLISAILLLNLVKSCLTFGFFLYLAHKIYKLIFTLGLSERMENWFYYNRDFNLSSSKKYAAKLNSMTASQLIDFMERDIADD